MMRSRPPSSKTGSLIDRVDGRGWLRDIEERNKCEREIAREHLPPTLGPTTP
jgi:hypothetical protein